MGGFDLERLEKAMLALWFNVPVTISVMVTCFPGCASEHEYNAEKGFLEPQNVFRNVLWDHTLVLNTLAWAKTFFWSNSKHMWKSNQNLSCEDIRNINIIHVQTHATKIWFPQSLYIREVVCINLIRFFSLLDHSASSTTEYECVWTDLCLERFICV